MPSPTYQLVYELHYFFGRGTGSAHNVDRSNGLALQMKRLGVPDDPVGYALLEGNLQAAALDPTNVVDTRINQWGSYLAKDSLFAGPSGKFALFRSVWQVGDNGTLNLVTLMAFGG